MRSKGDDLDNDHVKAHSAASSNSTSTTPDPPNERSSHKANGKARALDIDAVPSTTCDADVATFDNSQDAELEEDDATWCLICHSTPIVDRTVLPRCLHSQFCFQCILRWLSIKRRCPLCQTDIGDHIIHSIRLDDDYVRYHLPPAPSSALPSSADVPRPDRSTLVRRVQRARVVRTSHTNLAFRAQIYRHALFARHVGSNRHTRYRPCPSPMQIRADTIAGGPLARRITTFLRRDLSLWPHLDVEFLTKYTLSLLQVFEVSDDQTVRLVGEFLGEGTARHVLHELECFLRSGKDELRWYDESALLQYGRSNGGARGRSEEREQEVRRETAKRREKLLERLERERALLAAGNVQS
ncbi:Zinc finger, RING/FYVE/PHD-type [Kalmanozyma brasiliensis GHG001]|uniref:Zinc finger, RING/FYVE/PHD-type n=1 Tax=Kalmanozyma brasiliensis (strain GHG001) TaxID=1365824 RepID=UPI001CE738C3|nr:Zinc finger, RING/FYVE/PHD-type [Kalmanozyma brasiliensis GHG001]KAF6767637.1 Zinc finger, RING/FYVE/PHD-type [Kalmanozyma brasiliensis GHG001]